jgi:hypothetical protein
MDLRASGQSLNRLRTAGGGIINIGTVMPYILGSGNRRLPIGRSAGTARRNEMSETCDTPRNGSPHPIVTAVQSYGTEKLL